MDLYIETANERKGAAQGTATHSSTPPHTATHCDTLQHSTTHTVQKRCREGGCNEKENTRKRIKGAAKGTATHCNALQYTVTHCIPLHPTATHCNTLQHTTTHTAPEHRREGGCDVANGKRSESPSNSLLTIPLRFLADVCCSV